MVLNDMFLKAISWTLVHSLWQGLIAALLAGLAIFFTQKSKAALRYNLLTGIFLLFLLASGFTFYSQMQRETSVSATINLPLADVTFAQTDSPKAMLHTISDFLNAHSIWIVTIWLMVLLIKIMGMANGIGQVYRLRNYRTLPPPDYWTNRIVELAAQIGLRQPVQLLESALVKVPSVTGMFKPMILVPIGMLAGLPHDQAEAILLHELAHIRRKDYGINLLQKIAEMMFFFNPGLLWLSMLIREERENCCDDMAIGITENKAKFVHALVAFEEYQMKSSTLSLGFAGRKNHLLSRATRIIHNSNKSLNAIEKTLLSVSLLVIAVIMIACAKGKIEAAQTEESTAQNEADRLVAQANSASDEMVARANNEADQMAADVTQVAHVDAAQEQMASQDARHRVAEAKRIEAEAEFHYREAQRMRLQAEADQKQYEADQKQFKSNNNNMVGVAPLKAVPVSVATHKKTSKTTSEQMYERNETTYDTDDPTFRKKIYLRSEVPSEYFKQGTSLDDLSVRIITDLMEAKVISTIDDLSYKLSPGSLIVNGVKQSETLHAQLKKKYVKGNSYTVCYNFDLSGDLAIDSK